MWDVEATDEYIQWFQALSDDAQSAVLSRVLLLQEFGPRLGRPYADTLKGSTVANLKELRNKTAHQVLRVAYFFDEDRKALLLIGGDKKGKNEKRFYRDLITEAQRLIEKYRGEHG